MEGVKSFQVQSGSYSLQGVPEAHFAFNYTYVTFGFCLAGNYLVPFSAFRTNTHAT